jgi:hypothetical protein
MKTTPPSPPTVFFSPVKRLPARTDSLAVAELVGDLWGLLLMDFDRENSRVVVSRQIQTDSIITLLQACRVLPRAVAVTATPISDVFHLALREGWSAFEVVERETWHQSDGLQYSYSEPEILRLKFSIAAPACADVLDESSFWQASIPTTLDLMKVIKPYRLPDDISPRLKVGMLCLMDQAELIHIPVPPK